MGMSASQARLLSITARLTNNEFRAQIITNSKLRLATETQEASQLYMDALASQNFEFMYYDQNGNAQDIAMTPIFLSTYAPLKNQYSILNAAGKIMVSHTDAENFAKTDNLWDFLACYTKVEQTEITGYEAKYAIYQTQYQKYLDDLNEYYTVKLPAYNVEREAYDVLYAQYLIDYQAYLDSLGQPDLYEAFTNILGTSDNPLACYRTALWGLGGAGCYIHVLAHLLDWPGDNTASTLTYTATNGGQFTFNDYEITGAEMHVLAMTNNFKSISDEIARQTKYCDGDDNLNTPELDNNLKTIIDSGGTLTDADRLKSDYLYDDATGTYSLKTLYQKAIDLAYMLKNNYNASGLPVYFTTNEEIINSLINFTDGDMKNISRKPVEPVEPRKPAEPVPPIEPVPQYQITVEDKEKSQWYTNLWFKMNGSDTANLVRDKQIIIDEGAGKTATVFVVAGANKDIHKQNWEELDGNLATNSEWLEFALEHGAVTMEQARYYNPSADSGKVMEITSEGITWQSIIHKEAADIKVVDDEVAIAKAEAKYKHDVREIQDKDKKLDQDLKKLDTEHSALLTEFDSIKEAISKNEERSFKAFS